MPVYVDDMYLYPIGGFRGMRMSHLFADTKQELLSMVDKIDVARKWIQKEDTPYEHFDIALSKRKLAVLNGAIEIEYGGKQYLEILKKKKELLMNMGPAEYKRFNNQIKK